MAKSFIDEVSFEVSSGHGGAGAISFHREKFVPKGGPDGGDGGDGGDVVFTVDPQLSTFFDLLGKKQFSAESGKNGAQNRLTGARGQNVVLFVPPGTLIYEKESGELLHDFKEKGPSSWVCLKGGRGGEGNWHFRSARRQAPKFAQPGEEGQLLSLYLELDLIADIGFVGFPNAGKSSLLAALTRANPKVGAYPFTTKEPNLGVLRLYDKDIVLADIPGLLEGASRGVGLGDQFLRHVRRTASLLFFVDLSDSEHQGAFETLLQELESFDKEFLSKKRLIILTKTDLPEIQQLIPEFRAAHPEEEILTCSSQSREGLQELAHRLVTGESEA